MFLQAFLNKLAKYRKKTKSDALNAVLFGQFAVKLFSFAIL